MRVGKSIGEEEVKRHERIVFLGLFTVHSSMILLLPSMTADSHGGD